jgi:hypothetical protein
MICRSIGTTSVKVKHGQLMIVREFCYAPELEVTSDVIVYVPDNLQGY